MSTKEYFGVCLSVSFHKKSSTKTPIEHTILFTVSKKQIKGAVERNKIKRWAREVWRKAPLSRDKNIQMRIKVIKGFSECSYARVRGDIESGVLLFLSNRRSVR